MNPLCSALVTFALLGQSEPATRAKSDADDSVKKEAAVRLEFMKRSVALYDITLETKDKPKVKLLPDPVLRWNNPVSNVPDGVVFLWTGPEGRPELAAQVFIAAGTKDLWLHEFQSLSLVPFDVLRDGKSQWHPRKPGVEMKPIPDAPPPADSAVKRLAQMRAIVQDFEASDDFEGKSRWELRLLTKPLHRYGAANSDLLDGALFVFAHGTDPEVFLLLEARKSGETYQWHFGLAPMTAYALKATHKGQTLWTREKQNPPFKPEEPFYILKYVP